MSRIGKRPVTIPKGVKAAIEESWVLIEGPKGKLRINLPQDIKVALKDDTIMVSRSSDIKTARMNHGMVRAHINNMVIGVTEGYLKGLEIVGVGYKAQVGSGKLMINLGFTHPIEYAVPEGITIETPKPTHIIVKGIDKQLVGQVAAEIRDFYKPEPYKGKGIRYVGEYVRKKAGKTVA